MVYIYIMSLLQIIGSTLNNINYFISYILIINLNIFSTLTILLCIYSISFIYLINLFLFYINSVDVLIFNNNKIKFNIFETLFIFLSYCLWFIILGVNNYFYVFLLLFIKYYFYIKKLSSS